MNLFPVKTPTVVKKLYPNYIWDVETNDKEIYLTFDDGPVPEITPWVLSSLKNFEAKATFFCIGNNIKANNDIFQDIVHAGHSVGNHTLNHVKGWLTSRDTYINEYIKCQNLIDSLPTWNNQKEKLFRPPYGKIRRSQARAIQANHSKVVMWDVLSYDWDNSISKMECLDNVINNIAKGSIVVFHDSKKAWKNLEYVLPRTLQHFVDLGFRFKAL